MQSYNSILRYLFPILFLLQYMGCDSYRGISNHGLNSVDASSAAVEEAAAAVVVVDDCTTLKAFSYNGFYKPVANGKLFKLKESGYTTDSLLVADVPVIKLSQFKSVSKGYGSSGYPTIEVTLTEKGTELFKVHTANNIGKKLAIIIKDKLIVAPIIHSEIPGGQLSISGSFNAAEANRIHSYLNRMIQCAKED